MDSSGAMVAIVGDITMVEVDAIVNAANTELWMGSGVAGAIKRAGGPEIEREAVAKGPVELGGAVATSAGKLPHKRVIHAAAMGYRGGSMIPATAETVRWSTESALRVADDEGMTSIAFPALGTGVGGFDIGECVGVMVGAAADFLPNATNLREVVFVLRNEDAGAAFERAITRI